MTAHPKLVNKQFNSPIGLYSQQNIQEVLDREAQILANGAVGINFHNPDVGKPSNLKNSAVLRMLEEEENRQRNGIGPGVKRVAWPPPSETGSEYSEQSAISAQGGPQYSPQSPGLQQNNYQAPAQQQQQRSVSSNLPTNRTLKPLDVSTGSSSPLSSPLLNQSPLGFRPSTPAKGWAPVHSPVATPNPPSWQQPQSQYQQSATTTHYQTAHQSVSQQTFLGQQYQPQYQSQQQYQSLQQQYQPPQQQYQAPQQQNQLPQQQYQPPQQQYQPPQQQYQPPQQYQASPQQYQAPSQQQYQPQQNQAFQSSQSAPKPAAAPSQAAPRAAPVSSRPAQPPPPSTITLRPSAPVSQAPPPVVTSQPATATLRGGKHLRGDLKWPPECVRQQFAEENKLRLELAQGPACKPKRPNKDYTEFFSQHALNSTYPGYKIPPGRNSLDQCNALSSI